MRRPRPVRSRSSNAATAQRDGAWYADADPTRASYSTNANAGGSNIAVDGSGNLYVVYEDYPTGGGQYGRYRSNTGSGWSGSTDIAQDGYSPDVVVDTGNNVHIAYVKGSGVNSGKVYHRPGIGGSDTHVGNTTAATAAFDRVRLVTDSRNRPNVLWSTNADVGYAVKVGSSWTRQETIQEPSRGNLGNGRGTNNWSFGGLDPVIDSFDNVSWIDLTSGLVTGMYEPNLSCEDGCTTCGSRNFARKSASSITRRTSALILLTRSRRMRLMRSRMAPSSCSHCERSSGVVSTVATAWASAGRAAGLGLRQRRHSATSSASAPQPSSRVCASARSAAPARRITSVLELPR